MDSALNLIHLSPYFDITWPVATRTWKWPIREVHWYNLTFLYVHCTDSPWLTLFISSHYLGRRRASKHPSINLFISCWGWALTFKHFLSNKHISWFQRAWSKPWWGRCYCSEPSENEYYFWWIECKHFALQNLDYVCGYGDWANINYLQALPVRFHLLTLEAIIQLVRRSWESNTRIYSKALIFVPIDLHTGMYTVSECFA